MLKRLNKAVYKIISACVVCTIICLVTSSCNAQNKVEIGAYYFDGWTGTYPNHITKTLTENFKNREPKWGWLTSSQEYVDDQILEASKAGITFFNFCWYYHSKDRYKKEPLNRAYNYYKNSSVKKRLKHSILVTNHAGSEVGPQQWKELIPIWIEMFKDPQYLKVDGKPFLSFFEVKSLLKHFGSPAKITEALNQLNAAAVQAGLKGVATAICVYPTEVNIREAEACGFDLLTGYNYHTAGMADRKGQEIPIEKLQAGENRLWNIFPTLTKLKYIPVTTLGWDPRAWAAPNNQHATNPYYTGFSESSVYTSISNALKWVKKHKKNVPRTSVVLIYAWNENGEGAWLTPGKSGFKPLQGVQKATRR